MKPAARTSGPAAARATVPPSSAVAVMLPLVYVLWGSTSPAMKLAVASIPPFWMATMRFATAGSVLWAWCRLRGVAMPERSQWRDAAITGVVLLVIGNALYAWTLQFLPSGMGGLVFALAPLWMAIFAFAFDRERVAPIGVAGLAIGFAGMLFLYSPAGGQRLPAAPTAIALGTSLAWGFGSVLQRRFRKGDLVQTSAMQMLAAAAVSTLVALASREPLSPAAFAPSSLGALGYLIVFGSVVGFSAFLWLMNNVPTTLASTYAYVNPVVSLIVGIGFLKEPFSWNLFSGACCIIAGVALMVFAPRLPAAQVASADSTSPAS